jgi:hypothetical protein
MNCTKVKYATEDSAHFALAHTKRVLKKHTKKKRPEKNAYKCPICNYWHLTSRS